MIRFILNDQAISTDQPTGLPLLDLIRYDQHCTGTKIGCREGDCGACTVLVGTIQNDGELVYESATSCLMALGNAQGKHIVTVEGINKPKGLTPVQHAMVDESATQCGFCTPGFIMSLSGYCINNSLPTADAAIASVDGNICRCTGYKSIQRAATKMASLLEGRKEEDPMAFAVKHEVVPAYFLGIKEKLQKLAVDINNNGVGENHAGESKAFRFLGGGTDLYVQQHDTMHHANIKPLYDSPGLTYINQEGNKILIGGAATVTDLKNSPHIQKAIPQFNKFAKLVSSTPIRNMATLAGNFINASPIGDFTIIFLALNATVVFSDGASNREVALRKLYKGYKQLDKAADEFVAQIWFEVPANERLFNFEKVSKRTHLDIASVNSAISIEMDGEVVTQISLSAGGVGPVPAFLPLASAFLQGKKITDESIKETCAIAQSEISPISDARGTSEYKRLLLGQLIKAHFVELFEEI